MMRARSTPLAPIAAFLVPLLLAVVPAAAQEGPEATPALPDSWLEQLPWRCIGPANMGGRITDLAVNPQDPTEYWVATASGGLLHTTNNGLSYEHQFDHEAVVSLGAVAVAPSDPGIVWVGTGESNPRNSVSWGNGVYRSRDGGRTWERMGLDGSFQVGRIRIHPENPDIVYVGALGRLWGPNEERGLFKTTDGGKTWERVLYVDADTGVVDLVLKPDDPETLVVATWQRRRDGFDSNDPAVKWGPGSGLWRTEDGGATWERLDSGLPSCEVGRIGLDWYQADPQIVYAIIETERITQEPEDAAWMGVRGEDAEVGARLTEVVEEGPAAEAGLRQGDIVVRVEDSTIHSWEELTAAIRQHLAGATVHVEVSRDRKPVLAEVTFRRRPSEEEDREPGRGDREQHGRAAKPPGLPEPGPFHIGLGGQRENVQEQQGPEGHEYGGVYRSDDAGRTWRRINSLNPRPMYFSQIRVDPADNRYLYVLGVALYRSEDGGATFEDDGHGPEVHVDHHALWIDPRDGRHMILGNDGGIYVSWDRMASWDHHNHVAIGQFYHVTVDPTAAYKVYGGLQDNGSWGGPSLSRSDSGPVNADWFRIGGGDGFVCRVDREDPGQLYMESQNGAMGRFHLGTGERGGIRPRAPRGERYRFNWNTPFLLSQHNSRIHYSAGNRVFRSLDRGRGPRPISPEITATERGSATALAESPRDPDVLYVGSDDGALWATRDGGREWLDLWALGAPQEEATAPEAAEAEPELPERLRAFDSNGDGLLQAGELPERLRAFLTRADADGDGILSPAELRARRRPAPGPPAPPAAAAPAAPGTPAARPAPPAGDPLTGTWRGRPRMEGMPEGEADFRLELVLGEDNRVQGRLDSPFAEGAIRGGTWDPETGELRFRFRSDMGELEFQVQVSGEGMEGTMRGGGGRFEIDFSARRGGDGEEATVPGTPGGQPIAALLPGRRWVSSLVASRFADGRVYATLDGHRADDDAPYVFVSEDYGRTWRSLGTKLPPAAGSVKVIAEDLENPDLLFLGTEFGAWVSIDRGDSWTRFGGGLPTVAVHDFALHPTRGELVAATHGRSLWILDVTPLRQMTAEALAERAHLYRPNDVHLWRRLPTRGHGSRRFVGENPPRGVAICYSLARPARRLRLRVEDPSGEVIRELEAPAEAGLHRVVWDLRRKTASGEGRRRFRPRVRPGTFVAVLELEEMSLRQSFEVRADPDYPEASRLAGAEEFDEDFPATGEEEDVPAESARRIF